MRNILFFVLILLFNNIFCKLEELDKIDPCAITPPKALFTPSSNACTAPCAITFTNNSQNATTYLWDFGDLTTSTVANPVHTFEKAGNYTIQLTSKDEFGCSDVVSQVINISVTALLPKAVFTFDLGNDNGFAPAKVQFSNTSSNATNYIWSFGDGNFSTGISPLHEYKSPGDYTVKLKAVNTFGADSTVKQVSIKLIKFEQFYGGGGDNAGTSVKQTNDGGYIVTAVSDPTAWDDQAVLLKYDKFGNKQWEAIYNNPQPRSEIFNDVIENAVGGYYAVGSSDQTSSFAKDILFSRRNSDGSGGENYLIGGDKNEEGRSIIQTADGAFIIAGYTESMGNGRKDAYLLKVSSNGSKLWEKTYGGIVDDVFNHVIQTYDGGFLLTGTAQVSGFGEQIYIVKTDKDGNKKWEITTGDKGYDLGASAVEIANGEYIITGHGAVSSLQSVKAYAIGVKDNISTGVINWTKQWGKLTINHILSATKTNDGSVVMVGGTGASVITELYLLKVDKNGERLWDKSWGINNSLLSGNFIQNTSDGGLIMVGYGPKGTNTIDVYLVKTDKDGNR